MRAVYRFFIFPFLAFCLFGCAKYEVPYDTTPRPINLHSMSGYLGLRASEARARLSRTILLMDHTESAYGQQGAVLPDGATTLFAYANARPSWSEDDFATFIVANKDSVVSEVMAQRGGVEKGSRLYFSELWRGYVLPFLSGGELVGVYARCKGKGAGPGEDGEVFQRSGEVPQEDMRDLCEDFEAFYRRHGDFEYLEFALYASGDREVVTVLLTQNKQEGRSYYVHRLQVAQKS